jgi:ferredoxin
MSTLRETYIISVDNKAVDASHNSTVLSVLKDNNILVNQICGGQGMCATCHFFVTAGLEALTPPTQQEQKTLQMIKIDRAGARLACQTRVTGNGVIIEMPQGTFVQSEQDLEKEIGKKAKETLFHPMTGEILVERGKLVMRTAVEKMKESSSKFSDFLSKNQRQ